MPPSPYSPDLDEMRFALHEIGRFASISTLPAYYNITADLAEAVLAEAARFARDRLSPLNYSGDVETARYHSDGSVTMPRGFKEAYHAFTESGWNAAPIPESLGGQGLPRTLSTLIDEMWHGANMAFGLCPMLTQSAIDLIAHHASPELQSRYLPPLVSGVWTGTMCMTEPQAGSDVGAVRSRAVPENDYYRITGTKIFITYGEHDMSANIIHMVLARLPDAPAGSKGLSLFLVPKFLVNEDGTLGARNDVKCVSLEHKMGIKASPTAVMSFGEKEGAIGWLVGEAHKGIQAMFTMMNAARFAVGLEGVGIMGYAHQLAQEYAAGRMQGGKPIAGHGDVRRMLMTLRANSESLRALAVYTARQMDMARHHPNASAQQKAQDRGELLTPVVKAHSTTTGFEMASLAMQVFGGVGYIEETGVAQLMRDVRVAMIYEGTNGIQALDLVTRKIQMEEGRLIFSYLEEIENYCTGVQGEEKIKLLASGLLQLVPILRESTIALRTANEQKNADYLQEQANRYLTQLGTVSQAYMLLLSAICADRLNSGNSTSYRKEWLEQKTDTARFFFQTMRW